MGMGMGATGIRIGIIIGITTDAEGKERARSARLVALILFSNTARGEVERGFSKENI
jgi:hypothetical protein